MKKVRTGYLYILFCLYFIPILGRKHHLDLKSDRRKLFPISTFGFFQHGQLQVDVDRFKINFDQKQIKDHLKSVGFSLEKTANPYTDQHSVGCKLDLLKKNDSLLQQVFFLFDFKNQQVHLDCSQDMQNLLIYNVTDPLNTAEPLRKNAAADSKLFAPKDKSSIKKLQLSNSNESPKTLTMEKRALQKRSPGSKCSDTILQMVKDDDNYYNFTFAVYFSKKEEEGLYNLVFHNCYNYESDSESFIEMTLMVEARNNDNYLSAGKMPLPALYFMMSIIFFFSACFWFLLLKNSRDPVFKIHYLMGILVVIKSLSLLFHGLNYRFIQIEGVHMEAWAVMFYIMHLLKGALLFTVLALIGSGWAFIKHVLSSKEKKIFMMVIPLQIIANVATIIIEETEEWNPDRVTWIQLLFLIDFLCCVAILLPVVWSIRHLQEASQTDGKAAISLRKLKLFRHFYIMIVCYIYFTRIIVYLLQITVTFQYEWLDDMFRELATYIFFVMTGYKFRPATNNPYFTVESDDEEMDEVLTTTGLTENLTRVNQKTKENDRGSGARRLHVEVYDDDEEVNLLQDEIMNESSHAFD